MHIQVQVSLGIQFLLELGLFLKFFFTGGSNPGIGVGVGLLILVIFGAAVGAVWLIRKKPFWPEPDSAIAFENPSYTREPNPDVLVNVQISKHEDLNLTFRLPFLTNRIMEMDQALLLFRA